MNCRNAAEITIAGAIVWLTAALLSGCACQSGGGSKRAVSIPTGPITDPVHEGLDYLAREQDVFHNQTVVYAGLEAGGERFIPSGWMHGRGSQMRKIWDREDLENFSVTHVADEAMHGPSCMRIHYKKARFSDENVTLGFQFVERNWTMRGMDLTGATSITWYAKGKTGNELVTFSIGSNGQQDSCRVWQMFQLSRDWQPHQLCLKGKDLSSIATGFTIGISAEDNPSGCELFVQDITIDHPWLSEPRLIRSYDVGPAPLTERFFLRNCSYIYDNSVCGAAFLSSPNKQDWHRARLIADAFVELRERI